jgi:hypothetical protein
MLIFGLVDTLSNLLLSVTAILKARRAVRPGNDWIRNYFVHS